MCFLSLFYILQNKTNFTQFVRQPILQVSKNPIYWFNVLGPLAVGTVCEGLAECVWLTMLKFCCFGADVILLPTKTNKSLINYCPQICITTLFFITRIFGGVGTGLFLTVEILCSIYIFPRSIVINSILTTHLFRDWSVVGETQPCYGICLNHRMINWIYKSSTIHWYNILDTLYVL